VSPLKIKIPSKKSRQAALHGGILFWYQMDKEKAQTALFKDPVRTAH
jgi:hypothetical protein